MKIPSKILVGGIEYDVEFQQFIEIDSDRNFQGVCDYQNTKIKILESLSEERKEDVFFHEVTHAIFYEAGYDDQDEEMIIRIGKVLHQLIKNNEFRR